MYFRVHRGKTISLANDYTFNAIVYTPKLYISTSVGFFFRYTFVSINSIILPISQIYKYKKNLQNNNNMYNKK